MPPSPCRYLSGVCSSHGLRHYPGGRLARDEGRTPIEYVDLPEEFDPRRVFYAKVVGWCLVLAGTAALVAWWAS